MASSENRPRNRGLIILYGILAFLTIFLFHDVQRNILVNEDAYVTVILPE
jgi:hypothetical protein